MARGRYNFYTVMEFEFDPRKSKNNKERHGIDFEEAQTIWDDPDRIILPARTEDELRFAILGMIRNKVWIGIYTLRDKRVRIISCRRARVKERKLYES